MVEKGRKQDVYKRHDDNVLDPTFGRGMHAVHEDQTSIWTRIFLVSV